MSKDLIIRPLNRLESDYISTIAQWYQDEWETPANKTVRRLTTQPGSDVLFQLVAIHRDSLVATGGLCYDVNLTKVYPNFDKLGPWVALLYTAETARRRGIGEQVLERIEILAKDLRLNTLYLYTFTAQSLYEKCGWEAFDEVLYKGHHTVIMKKHL